MPVASPTLGDMLATVPHLLTSCIPQTEGQLQKIRLLRLVCKDVGQAAVSAATTCSVQLGLQACLDIEQLIQMMSATRLESLIVTVIMTSGKPTYE